MRLLPTMEKVWRSGDYTGPQRPIARVTILRPHMQLIHYGLMSTFRPTPITPSNVKSVIAGTTPYIDPYHGRRVTQTYANFLFAPGTPHELPNVKSVSWERSLNNDVATATIEFYNTKPGAGVGTRGGLDQPGNYTYNYGTSPFSSRWGHKPSGWTWYMMPDNIIRTYEGYGVDLSVTADRDPNLVPTGVWIIDSITMSALGIISAQCRDAGRLLLDHQTTPPVIPADFDPLSFANWDEQVMVPTKTYTVDTSKVPLTASFPDPSAKIGGHSSAEAVDGSPSSYWVSRGHSSPKASEYIELSCTPSVPTRLDIKTVKTGYTMYVSLMVDGVWVGPKNIPGGGIPYVATTTVRGYTDFGFSFEELGWQNVTVIRLTFTNLQYFPQYRDYRVGLRSVVATSITKNYFKKVNLKRGPAGANPGRFQDYTDMVKLACAWAGLYWPAGATLKRTDGSVQHVSFDHPDSVLGVNGRVWGDFENTGEAGSWPLPPGTFANKTLMDVITYVRDNHGYIFYVDEQGAVQWRLPNFYKMGSYITDGSSKVGYLPARSGGIRVIDEGQVLMSLDSTLSSASLRDGILVVNPARKVAVAWPGYSPNNVGLRRWMTFPDGGNLNTDAEAERAAEMTAVRMLFTYRVDRLVVPGFPGIQIDDQIRVFEQTTSEGNVHYVQGISSSNDLATGQWTFTLQTHWLGEKPDGVWAFPHDKISQQMRDSLATQRARQAFRKVRYA